MRLPRFSEENFAKNVALADKIQVIADKYKATPSQITLAWILATSENCKPFSSLTPSIIILLMYILDIPIPGCRSSERVEENAGGADLQLAPEDVSAIRALSEAADVQGDRYPTAFMHTVEGNCIPLEAWKGE